MGLVGAIIGDIAGSYWEFRKKKTFEIGSSPFRDKSRFTDDTVMSIATKMALKDNNRFAYYYHKLGNQYRGKGYGPRFADWLDTPFSEIKPYGSFGNGSAMRAAPCGETANSIEEALLLGKLSAEPTHSHPEGVKGAQATAVAVFMANKGNSKGAIKTVIEEEFEYDLSRPYDSLVGQYKWNATCQGSVPESIICFLESISFKDSIEKSIMLRGDTDTMACIAGGIAESYYGKTELDDKALLRKYLTDELYGEVYDGVN